VRDVVHVWDLARGVVLAVERLLGGGAGGTLGVGRGQGHSTREVIDAVERISGRAVPIQLRANRGDPSVIIGDPRPLRDLLGWSLQHDLADAVRHVSESVND
jgi:UDP-arabinose 4-epimerase